MAKISENEKSLSEKIEVINGKIDERADVKEEWRTVDDQVTTLSEYARGQIETQVKNLTKIIKYVYIFNF